MSTNSDPRVDSYIAACRDWGHSASAPSDDDMRDLTNRRLRERCRIRPHTGPGEIL